MTSCPGQPPSSSRRSRARCFPVLASPRAGGQWRHPAQSSPGLSPRATRQRGRERQQHPLRIRICISPPQGSPERGMTRGGASAAVPQSGASRRGGASILHPPSSILQGCSLAPVRPRAGLAGFGTSPTGRNAPGAGFGAGRTPLPQQQKEEDSRGGGRDGHAAQGAAGLHSVPLPVPSLHPLVASTASTASAAPTALTASAVLGAREAAASALQQHDPTRCRTTLKRPRQQAQS